jgi:hypothetical protein
MVIQEENTFNGGIPYYLPWNIWIIDYQYEKLLLRESLNSDGQ